MLSLEDYEVQTSQSVEEAVTAIAEKSFDAYVLDYRLRDGTGLDVAERLRSKGNGAPIILVSGYDLSGIASKAETLKVSNIIQKPFSRDELCDALKKSLALAPSPRPKRVNGSKVAEPVPTKKRLIGTVWVGAIILLLIVLGMIIYLLATGHLR
jgi:Response regulator containing CheY-like receiver, AAA-type ATPase, and DNA-binding domains